VYVDSQMAIFQKEIVCRFKEMRALKNIESASISVGPSKVMVKSDDVEVILSHSQLKRKRVRKAPTYPAPIFPPIQNLMGKGQR